MPLLDSWPRIIIKQQAGSLSWLQGLNTKKEIHVEVNMKMPQNGTCHMFLLLNSDLKERYIQRGTDINTVEH